MANVGIDLVSTAALKSQVHSQSGGIQEMSKNEEVEIQKSITGRARNHYSNGQTPISSPSPNNNNETDV